MQNRLKLLQYFIYIGAKSLILSSPEPPMEDELHNYPVMYRSIMFGKPYLPSFLWSNIHNRSVKYVTI